MKTERSLLCVLFVACMLLLAAGVVTMVDTINHTPTYITHNATIVPAPTDAA